MPAINVAAHGIFFAPQLEAAAEDIMQRMAGGAGRFNGAHLRIEEDWIAAGRGVSASTTFLFCAAAGGCRGMPAAHTEAAGRRRAAGGC